MVVVLLLLFIQVSEVVVETGKRTITRCEAEDGRRIEMGTLDIPEERFSEDSLTTLFRDYQIEDRIAQMELVAGPGIGPIKRRLSVWAGSPPPRPPQDPSTGPLPAARLYKLGRNRFFEYQLRGGAPRWVTIEGENLFSRVFSGVQVTYVGSSWRGPERCEETHQVVALLVPRLSELDQETVVEIVRFYNSAFELPKVLDLTLFENVREAVHHAGVTVSLHAAWFWKHAPAAGVGARVNYERWFSGSGWCEFEEPDGSTRFRVKLP